MNNLNACIEALIFMSGEEGITLSDLCFQLNITEEILTTKLQEIKQIYTQDHHGIELVYYGEKYHFLTKSHLFEIISNYLNTEKTLKLSQSSLETLSIIAYKQPITRLEIEDIRGISCEVALRKLQSLDLIEEKGRLESPGKPILYGVTNLFFETFKMASLNELPDLKPIEKEAEDFYQ